MPEITFIDNKGATHVVEAQSGVTLMQTALRNKIGGIFAECGGACACGTCHCYIDDEWQKKIPAMSNKETETLNETSIGVNANSRLSCQITVNDGLDGLIVLLPKSQM